MKRFDVLVLGAGMVGLGTALALLSRGRSVALVDRRGPAEETSYGNAGLIHAEAVMPFSFPRDLKVILGTLAGRRTDARVSWPALRQTAPWLVAFARAGNPEGVMATARATVPLTGRAVEMHRALSERAGAMGFWHEDGYVRAFRNEAALVRAVAENEALRDNFGIPFATLDGAALAEAEPHLAMPLAGAIHMTSPVRIDDPGGLGKAYAALFRKEGGTFVEADAMGLEMADGGFRLDGPDGAMTAREAVVTLGPWSGDLLQRLGLRVPLGVKRGYHRHYRPKGNAFLNRLVYDEENRVVLAPTRQGIRITSGAEFARRDDPPTPVQLMKLEPIARQIFPIGDPVEAKPWMGSRPCLPDLVPMVGPVPGAGGLHANFGHHHLGFSLGPATGELLAQMMTGEAPFADPAPYRVDRFGRLR